MKALKMRVLGLDLHFPTWLRNKEGNSFYDITAYDEWSRDTSNLDLASTHPLLSPAILFISKLYSQANFEIKDRSNKDINENHELQRLFIKPNYRQTFSDLLESLLFTQIANGVGVLYIKRNYLTKTPNALYVLDYALIDFPDELEKGKYPNFDKSEKTLNKKVIYDENNENIEIKLKDLLFFYDMPNEVYQKNPFYSVSRVEGLRQTLWNTKDSLIAKNIIIKSNGKELISGTKDGFPLTPDEKEQAEKQFNTDYGLSATRKRGLITKASIKWQSMHLIMRDLGHDEGIRTDASIVFTALHLPRDVYSIDGAKSTYKNTNQSLISYIQNEMQSTLESTLATINTTLFLDDNSYLDGNYDHLPVMLGFKSTEFEIISSQAKALSDLLATGMPKEIALEMSGFDKTIVLEDIEPVNPESQSTNNNEDITQNVQDG